MNGLKLETLNPVRCHFRLTYSVDKKLIWSVDLWPTERGSSRISWNPLHKGPILPLRRPWSVLDAVDAMIEAKDGKQDV